MSIESGTRIAKPGRFVSTSPEMAERLRSAGILYREYCIACHGPDGTSVPAMRVTLPMLPDFAKTSFRDQHSNAQLLVSILDGKGTGMPANRGRLTEGQARDMVVLVRTFAPAAEDTISLPPDEFQRQFELLQRQWEAYERDIRSLKKTLTSSLNTCYVSCRPRRVDRT
jgi:cytochrome c